MQDRPQEREVRRTDYEAALQQCANGYITAVATIYRSEKSRLLKAACRIVHDRDRADDIIHDAFVQIIRDARTFDPARGSARAWIYAIVRNTALKSCRTANREPSIGDDKILAIFDGRAERAHESCIAEYSALRAHLESLDPRRRASLILAIVDGRTHAEIAACLGVPLGTVKAWIRRELITLRAQFK